MNQSRMVDGDLYQMKVGVGSGYWWSRSVKPANKGTTYKLRIGTSSMKKNNSYRNELGVKEHLLSGKTITGLEVRCSIQLSCRRPLLQTSQLFLKLFTFQYNPDLGHLFATIFYIKIQSLWTSRNSYVIYHILNFSWWCSGHLTNKAWHNKIK